VLRPINNSLRGANIVKIFGAFAYFVFSFNVAWDAICRVEMDASMVHET